MKKLLLCLLLSACTTTTTTLPDGTRTVVNTQDPKVVKAITQAATTAALQALEAQVNKQNGLP